jgi:hypothetical protein
MNWLTGGNTSRTGSGILKGRSLLPAADLWRGQSGLISPRLNRARSPGPPTMAVGNQGFLIMIPTAKRHAFCADLDPGGAACRVHGGKVQRVGENNGGMARKAWTACLWRRSGREATRLGAIISGACGHGTGLTGLFLSFNVGINLVFAPCDGTEIDDNRWFR